MRELHQLGLLHGTDKSDADYHQQSYMDVYEIYLAGSRTQVRCVLELGVLKGASLKTWRDYFPQAEIWGVDINPAAPTDLGERVHILIGSQSDARVLNQAAPGSQFDLVIDDASHHFDQQIASFNCLWPRMRPGGLYVIEDRPGPNPPSYRLDSFFLRRIHDLDDMIGEIRFIHFWNCQVFIKKIAAGERSLFIE